MLSATSAITTARKTRGKIFYGWWIVAASVLANVISGGFYMFGFSAFFIPLVTEFGWSRAALSGAFAFSKVEGAVLGPAGGYLIDKVGPRKVMLIAIAVAGVGYMLLSRVNSLFFFYVVFILFVSVGITLGVHQATTVAVANWFVRKRGTALGISLSGVGLGGALVPLLGWLIVQHGWRTAMIVSGVIILAVGIPLSRVMRHRPEPYGYVPDGVKNVPPEKSEANSSPTRTDALDVSFSPRQALRTRAFWLLALVFGLRQLVVNAIALHLLPFLIGFGIQPTLAATMLGSVGVISILGRVGFGRLADIISARYVMSISLALVTIGCIILVRATSFWQVIVFLVIYSPGYGGGAIMMNALRGEYFGRQYFGTIMGFMDIAQVFGAVVGPIFAGWIYDISDSYHIAFITFAITAALTMLLVLFVRRPVLSRS